MKNTNIPNIVPAHPTSNSEKMLVNSERSRTATKNVISGDDRPANGIEKDHAHNPAQVMAINMLRIVILRGRSRTRINRLPFSLTHDQNKSLYVMPPCCHPQAHNYALLKEIGLWP